jgi:hypothetical protein
MANQYTKLKINNEAVNDYISGTASLTAVAVKYGITRKILTKWVKKSGFYILPNRSKKLNYDENIFSEIDTEEKAYWLGFIYADGYVSDKYNFEVSLALKDKYHLLKLGDLINKEVKEDSFRCRLGIRNKKLVEDLNKHGVFPRKSLVLKFPNNLNKKLIPHFIRGYFDGDGSIYYGKSERLSSSMSVTLIGTLDMLQNIAKHSDTIVHYQHDKRHHIDCYSFRVSKAISIINLLDYMYKDANIYLERKYEKYCRLRQKCFKLLGGNIGEPCDGNTEIS